MFCGKCGKEIKSGAKFCPNCGALVPESTNKKEKNRRTKFKLPHWAATILWIVIIILSAFYSINSYINDPSRELSKKELVALEMDGGISPYEFKQAIIENYGSSRYGEGMYETFDLNAVLDQYGKMPDPKSCHLDGLYLFTYSAVIDTTQENEAREDIYTLIRHFNALSLSNLVRNEDCSYYAIDLYGTLYGNVSLCFRIVGNSLIMTQITEDDERTPYEYLCSQDTEGMYHMDEVSEDNLYTLSSLQEIVTG